ncbi:MAG: Crp/Fnr family transcriptional regulator [Candidatus Goldiibacteriota bacterium]
MADLYFLAGYPIYRDFDADDIEVLASVCEEIELKKGEAVFREGEAGDSMYIVKEGNVNIVKETAAGRKKIAVISEGEFFGEMALIENSLRSASVFAGDKTVLIKLSTQDFRRLKDDFAKTGFKVADVLLKFMSQRIRRTTNTAAKLQKRRKTSKKKKKKAVNADNRKKKKSLRR